MPLWIVALILVRAKPNLKEAPVHPTPNTLPPTNGVKQTGTPNELWQVRQKGPQKGDILFYNENRLVTHTYGILHNLQPPQPAACACGAPGFAGFGPSALTGLPAKAIGVFRCDHKSLHRLVGVKGAR
jgi:hypothetical protein